MRINNSKALYNNYTKIQENEKSKTAEMKKIKEIIDVDISETGKVLLEEIAARDDIEYTEKVEKIRKSVMEGTYNVSSEDIAEKILEKLDKQKGSKI